MHKSILILLIFLFAECVLADVIINEIMYNPSGTDSGHEWIEIYTNGLFYRDVFGCLKKRSGMILRT